MEQDLNELRDKIANEVVEISRKYYVGKSATKKNLAEWVTYIESSMDIHFAINGFRWKAVNPHYENDGTALTIDKFELVKV